MLLSATATNVGTLIVIIIIKTIDIVITTTNAINLSISNANTITALADNEVSLENCRQSIGF